MWDIALKASIDSRDYLAFQTFLQEACGILLGDGKEYLVASRLNGLMAELEVSSLGELLKRLKAPGQRVLKVRVIDAMTTNETFWFRDPGHFSMLREKILPELDQKGGSPVRVWSAACSSGQEPYTLSMAVQDYWKKSPGRRNRGVEILATDISSRVLEEARQGIYCGLSINRGLDAQQQQRYFIPRENNSCLEVKPEIRQRVRFREFNLNGNYAPLGRFDIIFCRNVLIYFSSDLKKKIVERMAQSLNPGGYLFLGSTESLTQITDRFEMQMAGGAIAYRLKSN
ncbi:MAG: protein-glutamate O-methyltransferase CheR [gamma proteobacterium endosymbiont of Lamellibrachia anaximandri]|nr:protein-glutamate O-methyltransferase CheR [gamma proteobacterium endosymbiont of Lamellibrachia anaximandri]MBL3534531.1 protein-glutamate O-methyltransferase CheR [gamma proteobacterium endosymbiont of Lamellibrachia anaximandri]